MGANEHPAQTASSFTNEELIDSQTTQHDDNAVTKDMLISETAADVAANTMADAHQVDQYEAGMAALNVSRLIARYRAYVPLVWACWASNPRQVRWTHS